MTSLSDDALLDRVQRQTLRYFWDFGHPASGMARERSNPVPGYDFRDTVTTGGTGFGIMAMIAGAARGFLPRDEVRKRVARIVDFLARAERYHGVFPHFLHGATRHDHPVLAQGRRRRSGRNRVPDRGACCARANIFPTMRDWAPTSIVSGMRSSGTGTRAATAYSIGIGARGTIGR